jgi:hypothetical protein
VREVGRAVGKAATSLVGKGVEFYQEEQKQSAAEAVGGEEGKKFLEAARKAEDATRKAEARMETEGKGYDIRRQKTNPELLRMVKDSRGRLTTVARAAIDEPVGEKFNVSNESLVGEAKQQVENLRTLHQQPVQIAQEMGLPEAEKMGAGGKRSPYYATPDWARAVRDQRGPMWEDVTRDIADEQGEEPQEVKKQFTEQRGTIMRDPVELRRKYQGLGSRFPKSDGTGYWHVFEDDPQRIAERMIRQSSQRLGARSVFRGPEYEYQQEEKPPEGGFESQLPGPVPTQKYLNKIATEHGQDAASKVHEVIRMLHGMPADNSGSMFEPGSEEAQGASLIGAVLGTAKGAHLTKAGVYHVFQSFSNSYHLGVVNGVRNAGRVLRAFMNGTLGDLHKELVAKGVLRDSAKTHELDKSGTLETLRKAFETAGDILTKPLQIALGFNKLVDGLSVLDRLASMQEGNGGRGDRVLLNRMGFSNADAQRIAEGGGTKEEYDRYRLNAVAQLDAGGQLLSTQKSAAENSKWWNAMVWFQPLFQQRAREMASLAKSYGEAATPTEKAKVVGDFLSVLGFRTTAAGAGVALSMAIGGKLLDWLRESLSSPKAALGAMVKLGFHSLGGGVGSTVVNTVSEMLDAGDKGAFERISKGIVSTFGAPIGEAIHVAEMLSNVKDEGLLNSVGHYLKTVMPLSKDIPDGIFGITALAVSGHNVELDRSLESAYRWLPANHPSDSPPDTKETHAFRLAMRKVMDEVTAGRLQGGDPAIANGIRAAISAKIQQEQAGGNPVSVDQAMRSVAESLRGHKILPPESGAGWTKAQREDFHAHLGEKHWQTLQNYDAGLDYLASYLSGNPYR